MLTSPLLAYLVSGIANTSQVHHTFTAPLFTKIDVGLDSKTKCVGEHVAHVSADDDSTRTGAHHRPIGAVTALTDAGRSKCR